MRFGKSWLLGALVIVAGCAQHPRNDSPPPALLYGPPPQTAQELVQRCADLREEIAFQRTIESTAQMVSPGITILNIQEKALKNIAELEARAASLGCDGAPSRKQTGPKAHGDGDYFDLCMAKCKQYTDRTAEQCFDSCK